jgi:putative addiction module component (TIGR02574 family)
MHQPSREEIEKAIQKMPANEKIDLVDSILESLNDGNLVLTPAVRDELDKRLETYQEDRETAKSWDEVRSRWEMDPRKPSA